MILKLISRLDNMGVPEIENMFPDGVQEKQPVDTDEVMRDPTTIHLSWPRRSLPRESHRILFAMLKQKWMDTWREFDEPMYARLKADVAALSARITHKQARSLRNQTMTHRAMDTSALIEEEVCLKYDSQPGDIERLTKEYNVSPCNLVRGIIKTKMGVSKKVVKRVMEKLACLRKTTEAERAADKKGPADMTPSRIDNYEDAEALSQDIQKTWPRLKLSPVDVQQMNRAVFDDHICPVYDGRTKKKADAYEDVVAARFRELGLVFETEMDLRAKGLSQTPDLLLSSEPATFINGRRTTWIDCKMFYGCYAFPFMNDQANRYNGTYGPGLFCFRDSCLAGLEREADAQTMDGSTETLAGIKKVDLAYTISQRLRVDVEDVLWETVAATEIRYINQLPKKAPVRVLDLRSTSREPTPCASEPTPPPPPTQVDDEDDLVEVEVKTRKRPAKRGKPETGFWGSLAAGRQRLAQLRSPAPPVEEECSF